LPPTQDIRAGRTKVARKGENNKKNITARSLRKCGGETRAGVW
jgi:hypothetical protein